MSTRRRWREGFPADVGSVVRAAGGDANILGFYDCRLNATLNTGKLSTLDDARGAGSFGPQWVASGSPLPTIDASLGGVGITFDGTQNNAVTALSTKWDLSTTKWIAYIGSVRIGGPFALIMQDAGATRWLGVGQVSGTTIVADYTLGAGSLRQTSLVAQSTTQRLVLVASSNAGGTVEVGGRLRVSENRTAASFPASGTNQLALGSLSNGTNFAPCTVRAVIIGSGELTQTIVRALKAYASAYHTATVFDTSKNGILFDGDSLTFGTPTGLTAAYPVAVMAQAGMSGYDYQNIGIGGQYLATIGTNAPAKIDPEAGTYRAKDLYVLWAGTNDVVDLGTTDVQIIAMLKAQLTARRAAGFKTALIPPIPRGDAACTSQKLGYLKSVSDWCAASGASYADVVVPLYNHPSYNTWTFGASSAENASVYRADKIHLLDASYADIGTNATYGVYPALVSIR